MAVRNRKLAALALFVALTVLHTWPLASDPAHLSRLDNDDASLNTWAIAWVAHVLPRAPLNLFEAPTFYPERHTLAYSEHMVVQAVMGAPLLWSNVSPVIVHNLLFMLGMLLSSWAMCLLVTTWTGSWPAGVVAGMLYTFNALLLARFAHLQAQHTEFLPLMLYGLDRVLDRGRLRDAMILAAGFVLQSLCSNYLMVFCTFTLMVAMLVRPADWLGAGRGRVRLNLALAGAVSVVALAPFGLPYYLINRELGLTRSLADVARYSAGWTDYLATGGRLHYALWSHRYFENHTPLFPGIMALALVVVALQSVRTRRDPRVRMTIAFGLLGFAFSFGAATPGYAWLHTHVPLLGALRAAARWGWLALTAVAILAGYAVARLEERWGRAAAWPAIVVILGTLVTVEAARTPVEFTRFEGIPPIYDRLAAEPRVVLAEFPFYWGPSFNRNGPYMVYNTRYLQPLVNGYSSFQSRAYEARGQRLQDFPAPAAVDELRTIGVTHVMVHVDGFTHDFGPDAVGKVDAVHDLELVADEDGIRLYRLRQP